MRPIRLVVLSALAGGGACLIPVEPASPWLLPDGGFPEGKYVFTDGHSLASYTSFFDDVAKLSEIDWELVDEKYWASTPDDPDRQRRKQAEFLVHREFPWSLVRGFVVRTDAVKTRVEGIFAKHPTELHRPVAVRPGWYYDIPVVSP